EPIEQSLQVVLGNDDQVVDEDVRTQEDRASSQHQPEGMQCREVLIVDVAEESFLEARYGEPDAFRWRSDAAERSLLVVAGEGRRTWDACGVRLALTPQFGEREHPGAED